MQTRSIKIPSCTFSLYSLGGLPYVPGRLSTKFLLQHISAFQTCWRKGQSLYLSLLKTLVSLTTLLAISKISCLNCGKDVLEGSGLRKNPSLLHRKAVCELLSKMCIHITCLLRKKAIVSGDFQPSSDANLLVRINLPTQGACSEKFASW